ncbi:MAG: MOSC domain-containing protein, partial [Cyanobium sp.]
TLAQGDLPETLEILRATARHNRVTAGIRLSVLAIGENLRLRVEGGCPRCVITTLAQGELPETLEILRATARHNRVTAGIRLSVLAGGPLAVGDAVRWWAADPREARDGA